MNEEEYKQRASYARAELVSIKKLIDKIVKNLSDGLQEEERLQQSTFKEPNLPEEGC